MSTDVQDIVEEALSEIKVRAVGQTMSDADLALGLQKFINMIEQWAIDDLTVYSDTEENFTLSVGDCDYTIGSGGDFDTVRPDTILPGIFIRDSADNDHPVDIISIQDYYAIPDKTTSTRPTLLAYNPTFSSGRGVIYLWGTPSTAEDIYFRSLKIIGTYTALDDTILLPNGYKEALVLNLGVKLSPSFGKKVDADLKKGAKDALDLIKRKNIKIPVARLEVGRLVNKRCSGTILNLGS